MVDNGSVNLSIIIIPFVYWPLLTVATLKIPITWLNFFFYNFFCNFLILILREGSLDHPNRLKHFCAIIRQNRLFSGNLFLLRRFTLGISRKRISLAYFPSFIFLQWFHPELKKRWTIIDIFGHFEPICENVVILFYGFGLFVCFYFLNNKSIIEELEGICSWFRFLLLDFPLRL